MSGKGSESKGLPPLPTLAATPEEAAARKLAQEERDAAVRGVDSIAAMREAVKAHARSLPLLTDIPRIKRLDAQAFAERTAQGLPFLMTGVLSRWPLLRLTPHDLREQYGEMPVRARTGDYIRQAFRADRPMRDMTLREYLDLEPGRIHGPDEPPPYVGNMELRELNRLCHWPAYFQKMGPPRFWLGPIGTMTPLHCDFDDNIFAQIWGTKRIFLVPPHHDEFLYVREANPVLFGSPFDPEQPDFDTYPLARQANAVEVIVEPGDMLYVPAGWYHQVRALTFSLSSNRWARGKPLSLRKPVSGPSGRTG
ncbi:cupin-like domain-containing protein [uncultured Massilia sp.]|uniref:cupin-like domain-containing protein n=1 Tax=uncultured Massilia sp. TaxID=169973 RepID=UPI00258C953E|nr:cupin-like domain-containing protein [uncultured Massilia sp.]